MATDKSYRELLPSDVVPEKYDLTLEPDVETFVFTGVVKITCDVQIATETIHLHARELLIKSATFTSEVDGSEPALAATLSVSLKEYTAAIGFEEPLPVGRGVLEIAFQGTLNDQMAGFYRSKYTDSKGVKRHLATTQFEAIDARRCFPCWDEPARKAVFVVTLVYPASLMAVSNMPSSRSEIIADGRRKEVFLPTPKMSTYLLAFCVGEFEFISGQTKDGTLARVMACPGNLSKCTYSLSCCLKALDFYNDFFGIPYPLPKIDMIAIPDFSAGAMENWGLVTYREVDLLCDEKTMSITQKQRICSVVTHELAHQWFGNLVTMAWWDDLWLNEGFANWMQTFCADKLHPEWNLWEDNVAVDQQNALRLDALRSSHPIQVPIKKGQDVEEVFDLISYCKGGATVRMFYAILGEEKFQEGLRIYFDRHKYSNTETADLSKAWAEASGKNVGEIMESWTGKMGFPVLKVLKDPFAENSGTIELEQSWFLADGSKQPGDDEKTWHVPLMSGSDKGTAFEIMQSKTYTMKNAGSALTGASWFKLNFGQHCLVRVLYPASMVKRLAANMQSLPAFDRIGLLSDSFALVKAGYSEPEQFVELLNGFTGESNDKVWTVLSSNLNQWDKVLKLGLPSTVQEAFKNLASRLVMPAFTPVGWDSLATDDDNRKKLRSTLANLVADFGWDDAAVKSEAKKLCSAFLASPADSTVISADVRTAVLTCVMKAEASEELFDQLVAVHNSTDDGMVRKSIYSALGSSPPALKKKFLAWALTSDVRAQDMIYVPMAVASSSLEGANMCFEWIKEDYDAIYQRLGATSMMLFSHVVKISGIGFATKEKADEVQKFWEAKPVASKIEKALSQTVEGIHTNTEFVNRLKNSKISTDAFWQGLSKL